MYTVTNSHCLPMCGYETLAFDEWEELEAYVKSTPTISTTGM